MIMKPASQPGQLAGYASFSLLVAAYLSLAALCPAPVSAAESNPPAKAFTVFGKVTGAHGQPVTGVEVRANCGNGTLFCTGKTLTDAGGKYRLDFGPGILMGKVFGGDFGVGFQAATIFATKSGYSCADLCRAGNLAMTDLTNIEPNLARSFVGVVHPSKPYRLDFVLMPAARIEGKMLDSGAALPSDLTLCLGGKVLPPSSSVLASTKLEVNGAFAISDVPVGSNWWFEASWRESGEWKSAKTKPFSCAAATAYRATLILDKTGLLSMERFEAAR